MKIYRQDDIVIRKVRRLPADVRRQCSPVLAYGEETGHSHRLKGPGQVWRQDTQLYLRLEQPSQIVHEEHRATILSPRIYKVLAQREFVSPAQDRRVLD
ncbi:MAG TPA: hypothetical protein VJT32_13235 [bacterium]|nr:hypothetical protein [bacterium]